ncbi:MAG: hypothetical protein ACFE9L_20105 [Candidatus Hodarchaeota archaeon]
MEQSGAMSITSLRYHCRGEVAVPLWSQEGDTHNLTSDRGFSPFRTVNELKWGINRRCSTNVSPSIHLPRERGSVLGAKIKR